MEIKIDFHGGGASRGSEPSRGKILISFFSYSLIILRHLYRVYLYIFNQRFKKKNVVNEISESMRGGTKLGEHQSTIHI